MYDSPIFLPAGDKALVVEFGNAISPDINRRVRNLTLAVEGADISGVFDLMPTYRSVMIHYNPLEVSASELQSTLEELSENLDEEVSEKPQVVHIPVLYGGDYGPDIEFVAENAGLTPHEVIEIHANTDYLVYAMGFSPGFPYLGGLSEKLTTPRLQSPRLEIPAGSVGIAETQTGVYPVASPGGWQLIGRTPVNMFDIRKDPPTLLSTGNCVRFVPLDGEAEFLDIQGKADAGNYNVVVESSA